MTSRMTKLTTWTISDLSRLIRPPSCPPSAAAQAAPGLWSAHPTRARATAHTTPPVQSRPRCYIRRLSQVSCRSRKVCENYHATAPDVHLAWEDLTRDHAAADHALASVPDHRLPRRDRPLRLVEHDFGPVRVDHAPRRRRRRVALAGLLLDARPRARRGARGGDSRARPQPGPPQDPPR